MGGNDIAYTYGMSGNGPFFDVPPDLGAAVVERLGPNPELPRPLCIFVFGYESVEDGWITLRRRNDDGSLDIFKDYVNGI